MRVLVVATMLLASCATRTRTFWTYTPEPTESIEAEEFYYAAINTFSWHGMRPTYDPDELRVTTDASPRWIIEAGDTGAMLSVEYDKCSLSEENGTAIAERLLSDFKTALAEIEANRKWQLDRPESWSPVAVVKVKDGEQCLQPDAEKVARPTKGSSSSTGSSWGSSRPGACTKGCRCGNSCIDCSKRCRK